MVSLRSRGSRRAERTSGGGVVACAIGLVTAACGSGVDGTDSGDVCTGFSQFSGEPDTVLVLGGVEAPCRLEVRDTGIVLEPDPGGGRPDPGPIIVQDGRGRFYTTGATGFPSLVSVWDERGRHVTTFGRVGDGPGEFSDRGALSLFVDTGDRLHVRDGAPRWSVFDREQTLLRSTSAVSSGGVPGSTIVFEGGTLTSQSLPSEREHHFRLVDSTGTIVRRIAPVDPILLQEPRLDTRRVARGAPTTFWASPPASQGYSVNGYEMEEWSLDGRLLRTVRREADWFPRTWPPPPRTAPAEGAAAADPPPTQLTHLHSDGGLLLVTLTTPSALWRPVTIREMTEMSREERAAMFEIRIEAFALSSGQLIASQVVPSDALPFDALIPGTRRAAKMETGPDLLPRARIVEYTLVPN